MSGSAPSFDHHPHSDVHAHGRHGHGHDHTHDHHHPDPEALRQPSLSLLQVSALVRLAGAIGILVPLWIAVYAMVS